MENKAHALAAGVFVLGVLALLVAMAMWLTRDVTNTKAYEMVSSEAITGLQVQASVRFKGVPVGKVTAIDFDPTERTNVLITLAIEEDAPITRSTFATLAFQGVTGLSFVQLDDDGSSSESLAAGPNGPPRIPLRPNVLGQLSDQVSALREKVDGVVDNINHLLAPDNQAALMQAITQISNAASSASQLARSTEETLRAQFDPAKASIPALIRQADETLQAAQGAAVEARATLNELRGVAADARQGLARLTAPGGALDQIQGSVDTVVGTTLPRVQQATREIGKSARQVDRFTSTLNDNPQALLYGNGAIPPGPGEPGFAAPLPATP